MEYRPIEDGLAWDRPLGETGVLTLRAESVHQERTGVHARVYIDYHEVTLAWSTFNVERDEDRVRLSNSAYPHLNGASASYPKAFLKKDLDLFCQGLWQATLGQMEAEWMEGTREPVPVRFALHPYVVHEGGTILFAHPGRGKSYLALLMAVSIDAGAAIPEARRLWTVDPRRVLFINLERGREGNRNRLGNVNQALGLPRTRPLLTMNQRGRSLQDIIGAARHVIRKHKVEAVLLDSISRAGMGDLNDNQPVNRIMDGLNSLVPTWIGIAHAPRASEEHVFGGIHFDAAADVIVRLTKEQQPGGPLGLGLEITKENDVGQQPRELLALEFGPDGLVAVREAAKGEFPELEAGKPTTVKQVLVDYFLHEGEATATQAAAALKLNRQHIVELLRDTTNPFIPTRREGKQVFYMVRQGYGNGRVAVP